jgi:hypothetical protein
MEPSPIPPTAPAPLPVRASRAALANIMGWPAVTLLTAGYLTLLAQLHRWRFRYDPGEHDWQPAVLAPVASYVLKRRAPSPGNLSTAGRARLIEATGNRAQPSPMIPQRIRHV